LTNANGNAHLVNEREDDLPVEERQTRVDSPSVVPVPSPRPLPLFAILSLVVPLTVSIAGFCIGLLQGSGSFRLLVAMAFGIPATAIGLVIGIAFGISARLRHERDYGAAVVSMVVSVLLLILIATLYFP
jgi:hypothetical protein